LDPTVRHGQYRDGLRQQRRRHVQGKLRLTRSSPRIYTTSDRPAAVWQAYDKADDGSFLNVVNMNGVGSGPYMYKTAAQDRMVWVKNPAWWASAPRPRATASLSADVRRRPRQQLEQCRPE